MDLISHGQNLMQQMQQVKSSGQWAVGGGQAGDGTLGPNPIFDEPRTTNRNHAFPPSPKPYLDGRILPMA
jgi:hypothetical protein